VKLRDRDSIVTEDGIIFRVYGYNHPPNGYVCDPEYASTNIFKSLNPRARRGKNAPLYYKFFADEGLKLILKEYPQYTIFYEPLQKQLVGINTEDIKETRRPETGFQQLIAKEPKDALHKAFHDLHRLVSSRSGLPESKFGVFGSLLHGFYHPKFSDIDLIVYSREGLKKLCEALADLYREGDVLCNEFDSMKAVEGKNWMFVNYTLKDYLWHQRRKLIYGYFKTKGRVVKAEFEPVKKWDEIRNEYSKDTRITNAGWIKAVVKVTDDQDAPFIPSIYPIDVVEVLEGPKVDEVKRIFSYMEEFRMQAKQDERILVEGNLEKVVTGNKTFHQITLTYGPRYYEQTLKVIRVR
jgi:predicted nucleotidyltransferase